MVEIINISDWNIKEWIQTTGTRNKFFVGSPVDEKLYFFKESISKYPSEFWSEIIASKVGSKLGFDLLDYNVGIYKETVGCICESMIDVTSEELEHGISLIKKTVPSFKVSKRPIILFQHVEKSFLPYGNFITEFIEMLVFDSIIGNQDRHSENWAIIRSLDVENIKSNKSRLIKWAMVGYRASGLNLSKLPFKKYFMQVFHESALVNIKFSPIYDSGSSLGREIPELNISNYTDNPEEVKKYIKNGKSEVKWDGTKINHFEILKKLKETHGVIITNVISKVLAKYNSIDIKTVINEIDSELPQKFEKSRLSLERKKLIITFIEYRIQELKSI